MAKKKNKKTQVPDGQLAQKIIEDSRNGISKKEIANKYGINLGMVWSICNKNKADSQHVVVANQQQTEEERKEITSLNVMTIEEMASDISLPEEEEVTADEVEAVVITKKRKTITPEIKKGVIADYFGDKKITQAELAELYEISASSVSRIIADFNEHITGKKKKPATEEVGTFDPSKLVRLNPDYNVRLGLIADRHDMPVTEFVYDEIDEDLMFNYDKLDKIAEEQIKKHIPFKNSVAQKNLILYTSGLQSALTSVNKVCTELNVPLTIMHYSAKAKMYIPQVVSESVNQNVEIPSAFDSVCSRANEVYLYGITAEEVISKGTEIPEVCECTYDDEIGVIGRKVTYLKYTIFGNDDDAWQYFKMKACEFTPRVGVYLNYAFITRGKYCKDTSIARACN